MTSNTDPIRLIYSTEHIRVKAYKGRGHPLAVNIPLRRLAEADERAQAALFLLSDRASYVRHTYTTLLTQNNEEVKVVREFLRHANSRISLDLYAQAGMPNKRLAQSKLVRLVLNMGEAQA